MLKCGENMKNVQVLMDEHIRPVHILLYAKGKFTKILKNAQNDKKIQSEHIYRVISHRLTQFF